MSAARSALARSNLARFRGSNNEGFLVLALALLAIVVGLFSPSFWSVATLLNVGTNSLENVVFAMGVLIVILTGGFDVSFMAIGIFAGYTVVILANSTGIAADSAVLAFAIALGLGVVLGLLNAFAIAGLRLPTLIATLGTAGIIRGFMLAFIGRKVVPDYPPGLQALSTTYLYTDHAAIDTRLSVLIIPSILICVAVSLLLRYTLVGRGIFALGDDAESARRAGFPVTRLKVIVYLLAGALAGTAGMMHVTQVQLANPYELYGGELDVIAAVVLGGASIFGGKGSVSGTVLGVVLIAMIKNSLILLGVPGAWQRAAVGGLLLLGVSVQAISVANRRRRGTNIVVEEAAA